MNRTAWTRASWALGAAVVLCAGVWAVARAAPPTPAQAAPPSAAKEQPPAKAPLTRADYDRLIKDLEVERAGLESDLEINRLARTSLDDAKMLFVPIGYVRNFGLEPNRVGEPFLQNWRLVERDKFAAMVGAAMAHGLWSDRMTLARAQQVFGIISRLSRAQSNYFGAEIQSMEDQIERNRGWVSYYLDQRNKLPAAPEVKPAAGGGGGAEPVAVPAGALKLVDSETKVDAGKQTGTENQYVHWDSITGTKAAASGQKLNPGVKVTVTASEPPAFLVPEANYTMTLTVSITPPGKASFQTPVWIEAALTATNVQLGIAGDANLRALAGFKEEDGQIESVATGSRTYTIRVPQGTKEVSLTPYVGAVGPMATYIYRVPESAAPKR